MSHPYDEPKSLSLGKILMLMKLFLTILFSALLLGNSHTYFHSSYTLLPQIARAEGCVLDINVFTRGGYCFSQHLDSPYAMGLVRRGGYDIVFLQDRSMYQAFIGTAEDDSLGLSASTRRLIDSVRRYSPKARIIIEAQWAHRDGMMHMYGIYDPGCATYDSMQSSILRGESALASASGASVSPIGTAFRLVRADFPSRYSLPYKGANAHGVPKASVKDIELWEPDCNHATYAGMYLKCCVNYLVITGKRFGRTPFNGELDSETAAYLREIAEKAVFDNPGAISR